MGRKQKAKNQTEMQKSHFSDSVIRTLKARITHLNEKSNSSEEILQFFVQSLGNTCLVWNTFLNLSHQKYTDFKALSDEERAETVWIEKKNKKTNEVSMVEKPKYTSYYTSAEFSAMLTQLKKDDDFLFLKNSHSQSLQNTVEILSDSLIKSIQKRVKGEKSEIRFKKKKDDSSFLIKQVDENHIDFKKGTILLPKLKQRLRFATSMKKHRDERVKTVQIIKEGKNWFISFTLEKQETEKEKLNRLEVTLKTLEDTLKSSKDKEKFADVVGFDFGVTTFLTSNDGKKYTLPAKLKQRLLQLTERLWRIQRQSSKRQLIKDNLVKEAKELYHQEHGSLDGFKATNYIAKETLYASNTENRLFDLQRKLYKQISNLKHDFLHKLSTTLSKNHAITVFEKLNMKKMTKSQRRINLEASPEYREKLRKRLAEDNRFKQVWSKRTLNRKLLNLPFGHFMSMMAYKQQREAHIFIQVEPAYTSQRCFECHHTEEDNRPEQAIFHCIKCGHSDHADVNAGKNIRHKALSVINLIRTELITLKNTLVCGWDARDLNNTPLVAENSVVS